MQGTRRQGYTRGLTLLLAMAILGCSEDTEPEPLTGTWTGTLQDSLGGRGTLRLEISQTNRQLMGTWQRTFADARSAPAVRQDWGTVRHFCHPPASACQRDARH